MRRRTQLGSGASALRSAVQTRLTAIGSSLTPDQIVARATALSCAGCHQLSNGADLGGGVTWPSSLGFTQVSELTETGPDGPRFQISSALSNVFLPHRAQVPGNFVASITPSCPKNTIDCCGMCIDATQGCPIVCPPPSQDQ